jgi:hypothetical protein
MEIITLSSSNGNVMRKDSSTSQLMGLKGEKIIKEEGR